MERIENTIHSKATSLGYPIIRGNPKKIDGVLCTRFKNKEGQAIYVGQDFDYARPNGGKIVDTWLLYLECPTCFCTYKLNTEHTCNRE